MQKDTSARAASGVQRQHGRGGGRTDARAQARDVDASQPMTPEPDLEGDRLDLAVIEMQINNIHLELDAQMHRTAQLETLLIGIRDELRELIEMVTWLRHEMLDKSGPVRGGRRNILH